MIKTAFAVCAAISMIAAIAGWVVDARVITGICGASALLFVVAWGLTDES